MANVLNFKLTLEDLLGPKVAAAIQKVGQLGSQVDKPHKLNVDTSQANGAISGLMGLVGKLGLAAAFATGAKAVVGMGVQMEQTRIQFETFTGSAEKSNAVIADLQKFANLTPFDDEQVISAGRQLLAFGEDAKSLNPILTKLGNISSATGKDFNELVSIYGKNKLSGIIQGEDLNQLNDSGIPVMKSLAAQLGVNVSQVRKMGAEGKITFAMLDKSFDELGGKSGKWGNLMDKQSQTVAGRWSSLVGLAQNLGSKVGEMLNPLIGQIVDKGYALLGIAGEVVTWVQTHTEGIKRVFQPLWDAMQPLVRVLGDWFSELTAGADTGTILTTVFETLGNVFRFIQPAIAIAAELLANVFKFVVRITKAVWQFVETSPRLQKFFVGLWTGAMAAFRGIAEAGSKFLGGIGHLLEGILTMDWGVLKQGFSETINALGDTQKVGTLAAEGFVEGYRKGFKKELFFGSESTPDAATAFAQGKATGQKPAAMTAAASKGAGAVGGSAGGSRVQHITLEVRQMLQNMTIHVASASEGAKEIAQLVRDTVIAELNDVNTLASTN